MKGRVAFYEAMPMTGGVRDLVLKGGSTSALRDAALQAGMRSLRQAGLAKALEGVTTVEEVLRVTLA
jgi:type IV pilus assembly protein PilB